MDTKRINPIIIPAHTAVMLCFMPDVTLRSTIDRPALTAVVRQVEQQLPTTVRLLRINESDHPEVVKSFNISELPTFVLVQQGVEQWRLEGMQRVRELASMPAPA